ncbi:MAG: hypothetical protein ACNA7Q_09305 [Rhodobacterales bacterium]
MTTSLPNDLMHPLADIEARIRATPPDQCRQLHADLRRLCDRLEHKGFELPDRLRNLDRMLTEAAVEDQFDNMPV